MISGGWKRHFGINAGRANRTKLPSPRHSRRTPRERFFEFLEQRLYLAVLPADFSQLVVATTTGSEVALEISPDGKIYVTKQDGAMEVWSNGASSVKLQSNFFANSPLISNAVNERGLLGLAFSPTYASDRFIYVFYTTNDADTHNRISRFKANATGDLAIAWDNDNNPATANSYEDIIMELDPHSAGNHNGGAMHFSPTDGYLYITTGDNATGSNAQTTANLHGKVLRINVNGDDFPADPSQDWAVPAGQPTVFRTGNGTVLPAPTGKNQAIWAIGLRNPFTSAMQPVTGRFFINNVGDGVEEINDGIAGANYGWPATEGYFTATGNNAFYTNPLFAYNHSFGGGSSAITGGTFYNPTTAQFPSSYNNKYFFSDFGSDNIWVMDLTTFAVTEFASGVGSPVDLKVDPQGNLYVLERNSNHVLKISYTNAPPAILTQPQSQTITFGDPVSFTVSASGNATPLSYQWQRAESGTNNFLNIGSANGTTYTLSNVQSGDNQDKFRVVVTDNLGQPTNSDVAILTATSNHAPVPVIQLTDGLRNGKFDAGTQVTFSGTASDLEEGQLAAAAFTWRVDLITSIAGGDSDNDGLPGLTRPFDLPFSNTKTGNFTSPTVSQYLTPDIAHLITLTVTDSQGRTGTTQMLVYPNFVTLNLVSVPAGLQLTSDGIPRTAPFDSVVGWQRPLVAASGQTLAGTFYDFASWSDGGAASHTISTPQTNTTYTANFVATGFSAKVNFQIGTTINTGTYPILTGYVADSGLIYGDRGNGFSYGWNVDNTGGARNRDSANSPDERYDTFIHMQNGGNKTWEIALANGTYNIHMVAGDAGFADSINSFTVEGIAAPDPDGQVGAAFDFDDFTINNVVITDGKLTIIPTGTNAKIDFIDISLPAPSGDTTNPTVATGPTVTPVAVSNTANLAVLGADNSGEPGLKYTWSVVSSPAGAVAPTFSVNGTNASKNSVASFFKTGSYTLHVTIADAANNFVVSNDVVTNIDFGFTNVSPAGTFNFTTANGIAYVLNVVSGTATVSSNFNPRNVSVSVANSAAVIFSSSQTLTALTLGTSSVATLSANGNKLLILGALTLATSGGNNWTSRLDLTNNDMILNYAGATPFISIKSMEKLGVTSNQTLGITSTNAISANDTLIAVVDNVNMSLSTFNGQTLTAPFHQILAKYTYYGDANLDGKVLGSDYTFVDSNIGANSPTIQWNNGDFNLDDKVNGPDYTFIDSNINKGSVTPLLTEDTTGSSPVPLSAVESFTLFADPTTETTSKRKPATFGVQTKKAPVIEPIRTTTLAPKI